MCIDMKPIMIIDSWVRLLLFYIHDTGTVTTGQKHFTNVQGTHTCCCLFSSFFPISSTSSSSSFSLALSLWFQLFAWNRSKMIHNTICISWQFLILCHTFIYIYIYFFCLLLLILRRLSLWPLRSLCAVSSCVCIYKYLINRRYWIEFMYNTESTPATRAKHNYAAHFKLNFIGNDYYYYYIHISVL